MESVIRVPGYFYGRWKMNNNYNMGPITKKDLEEMRDLINDWEVRATQIIMSAEDWKIIQLLSKAPTYFIYKGILKNKCTASVKQEGERYTVLLNDPEGKNEADNIILEPEKPK